MKVSVLMPVYNGESLLEQAMNNIVQQSYKPDEVIIYNDGSTDRTSDIISSLLSKYEFIINIKYLSSNENRGRGFARNALLASVDSDIVAWFDLDDLWHPDKLEKQVKCYVDLPQTIKKGPLMIVCDYYRSSSQYISRGKSVKTTDIHSVPQLFDRSSESRVVQLQTVIHNILPNIRIGFDEGLNWSEDFDFIIRFVSAGGKIFSVKNNQDLAYYFQDTSKNYGLLPAIANKQLLRKNAEILREEKINIVDYYKDKYKDYLRKYNKNANKMDYNIDSIPADDLARAKRISFSNDFLSNEVNIFVHGHSMKIQLLSQKGQPAIRSLSCKDSNFRISFLDLSSWFSLGIKFLKVVSIGNDGDATRHFEFYRRKDGLISIV